MLTKVYTNDSILLKTVKLLSSYKPDGNMSIDAFLF